MRNKRINTITAESEKKLDSEKKYLPIKQPKYNYHLFLILLNNIKKGWITEHKFCPDRKWRFDYAHPEYKIATEIEGGIFVFGRHNRASGYIKDMEKYNMATILGWKVLRYTPQQLLKMGEDVKNLFALIKEGRV